MIQKLLDAIEDPGRFSGGVLGDDSIEPWALFKMEATEPSEEVDGYRLLSYVPSICKKDSGIYRKLQKMAQRAGMSATLNIKLFA